MFDGLIREIEHLRFISMAVEKGWYPREIVKTVTTNLRDCVQNSSPESMKQLVTTALVPLRKNFDLIVPPNYCLPLTSEGEESLKSRVETGIRERTLSKIFPHVARGKALKKIILSINASL